jgi:hypothetical protein
LAAAGAKRPSIYLVAPAAANRFRGLAVLVAVVALLFDDEADDVLLAVVRGFVAELEVSSCPTVARAAAHTKPASSRASAVAILVDDFLRIDSR